MGSTQHANNLVANENKISTKRNSGELSDTTRVCLSSGYCGGDRLRRQKGKFDKNPTKMKPKSFVQLNKCRWNSEGVANQCKQEEIPIHCNF